MVGNLSSKASCLIRDPLNVFMHKLPDWIHVLLTRFPFLVAHDVRLAFFDLEAFGLVRALKNAGRNRDGRSERQNSGHTQHRQKVRVGRQHILESAKHIMALYTNNAEKTGWTLEVEFSGEVGVGKGPTQEFFTFFCRSYPVFPSVFSCSRFPCFSSLCVSLALFLSLVPISCVCMRRDLMLSYLGPPGSYNNAALVYGGTVLLLPGRSPRGKAKCHSTCAPLTDYFRHQWLQIAQRQSVKRSWKLSRYEQGLSDTSYPKPPSMVGEQETLKEEGGGDGARDKP